MISIVKTIQAYQVALQNLPSQKAHDLPSKVMGVLLARDNLAHALSDFSSLGPETLSQIIHLGQELKAKAAEIEAVIGHSMLAAWRETVQPPASAWWWYLDEHAATAEPEPSPLPTISAEVEADMLRIKRGRQP